MIVLMTIQPDSSQASEGQPRPPDVDPPQQAPMRTVRPLRTAVIVLLAVWAVAAVGFMVVSLVRASLVGRELDVPGSVGVDALTQNDNLYALSGGAYFVTYLAAAVIFLVWLFRARNNAEFTSALQHRRSKVWLVLGWVVPVVSLWFPKQIVDDIWRSSDPHTPASATDLDSIRKPGLVYGWWAAFLGSTLLTYWLYGFFGLGSVFWPSIETLEEIRTAAIIDSLVAPIELAAALLAALVVARISEFQEAWRGELET